MNMKQSLISLMFVGLISAGYPALCKTTSATSSGNWTTGGIWDNGVPASGDIININSGVTVTINSTVDLTGGAATIINIFGTLSFDDPAGLFNVAWLLTDSGDGDIINILVGGVISAADSFGGVIWSGSTPITIIPFFGDPPINGPATISNGVLPIELISFKVEVVNDVVELKWVTATELNNDYFTIERASNIEQFEAVGNSVQGSGTSNEQKTYTAVDPTPLYGRSYYRLKQTDYDGQFTYSNVNTVDFDGPQFSSLRVYPNPTNGHSVTVELIGLTNQLEIPFQVFDSQGKEVYNTVINTTKPSAIKVDVEFGNPLQSGLYIIKAGPSLRLTRKLVVN
jgi:hypothetical protein